jgi:hypothetical protein
VAHYLKRHSRKGPMEWLMRKTADISLRRPQMQSAPEHIADMGLFFYQKGEVHVKAETAPLSVAVMPKTTVVNL